MKNKTIILIAVIITGIVLILISSCATSKQKYNQHCTYKETVFVNEKILFHPTHKQKENSKLIYN
jgi:hypothetical protein